MFNIMRITRARALCGKDIPKYLDVELENRYVKTVVNNKGIFPICHRCGGFSSVWTCPKQDVVVFACSADCLKELQESLKAIDFKKQVIYINTKTIKPISKFKLFGPIWVIGALILWLIVSI